MSKPMVGWDGNGSVLNIGRLGPGAREYYVGEVATSAEDYYTGRGEAKGRWVGSLRETLGLDGEVGRFAARNARPRWRG